MVLYINISPALLSFKHLNDEDYEKIKNEEGINLTYSEKGYFYVTGDSKELYNILLKLSYKYDIELI